MTLTVRGPGIEGGRVSISDLMKICQGAQNAVRRQAEALKGRGTLHRGPVSEQIRNECTLELIAIRAGSTALDFALQKPQTTAPLQGVRPSGGVAIEELTRAIQSLADGNEKRDLDPGVLQSLYELSSVVEAGRITELEWIAPGSGREEVKAVINEKIRDRAGAQLSGPRFRAAQIDGVLDMADFSHKDRRCRIDPAIGPSVTCSFGPDHEGDILALLRQPVRATGLARIQPRSDRVDSLEIQRIEALPSLSLGEDHFILSPDIQQLAASQHIGPFRDAGALGGVLTDEEVEDFVAEIYRTRGGGG